MVRVQPLEPGEKNCCLKKIGSNNGHFSPHDSMMASLRQNSGEKIEII
jgi:hypothetical protein